MLLMDKMELTAYRYLGSAGSCFTAFQGAVWLVLSLAGALCKYIACGSEKYKKSFSYCFYLIYYHEPGNVTANFTRVNFVSPSFFHAIMWINVLFSITSLIISIFTAKAFIQWMSAREIRKMAFIWTRCILFFAFCEFIMFVIFASEIVAIKQKEDVKCFLKSSLSMLQSTYPNEPSPAPYLLQLKSNLQRMRKKIRKFKRNLLFLDAIYDDKSPDYVKNPFISKKVINTYVEDIWKDMFNNNIGDKIRRNSDAIPSDEVMKNFIINEHIDLDDIDNNLLQNFDGLTNNELIKPIRRTSVVFGEPLNLSASITSDNSTELDKMANLLHDYIKDNDTQNRKYLQTDENFNEFSTELLDKLENQETHYIPDKNQTIDLMEPNNEKDDEYILNLERVFDSLVPQEPNESEYEELNNQNFQTLIENVKEFLENNNTLKLSDSQIISYIKEAIENQYDTDMYIPLGHNVEDQFVNRDLKPVDPDGTSDYKNDLVKELCENCAYFILGPSIVCMIMSLKTGFVWILNITAAVLVLYYGTKVRLKMQIKKCKLMMCFSKKEFK